VTPFLVRSSSQFDTRGPDAMTSRQYAKDFNEVKDVGSAASTATRTGDQTLAVRYWMENAAGTWSRIVRGILSQRTVSLADEARLSAMLYMTTADSLITVWTDKAYYSFWRPITAIREAGSDGNPATAPDTGWLPAIATPPYPDHPSGAVAVAGSMVYTLRRGPGGGRRARVVRHPLPERRRAVREAGRTMAEAPLLPVAARRRRRRRRRRRLTDLGWAGRDCGLPARCTIARAHGTTVKAFKPERRDA
jgi:hypothetical protein